MRTTICPADHKHGQTPTCYRSHKCGCAPCRESNTKRGSDRKRLIAYGLPTSDLISPDAAREHIGKLAMAGMRPAAIAAAAGIDPHALTKIMRGTTVKMFADTEAKILAVPLDLTRVPDNHRVDARGSRRRLQALGAKGWAVSVLADIAGIHRDYLDRAHRNPSVRADVHRMIVDLFDRLWDQEPPAATRDERYARTLALQAAKAGGWLPALAWDDIDLDEYPAIAEEDSELVDDVAIALALRGERVRLTAAERAVVIARAPEAGLSVEAVAPIVGITARHVGRLRRAA